MPLHSDQCHSDFLIEYLFVCVPDKMKALLRLSIFLLIAHATMVNFRVLARSMSTIAQAFVSNGIVPDVVAKAPAASITVSTLL